MKPSLMLSRAFWYGFALHACACGFINSIQGKAEYIQYVKDNWINAHWAMWLVLGLLFYAAYARLQRKVNE